MEPKKIKKLVLRKETISNLSGFVQNRIKGGGTQSVYGQNCPETVVPQGTCGLLCKIVATTKDDLYKCDLWSVGHDDGWPCVSEDPNAWCYGN